jgi:shikimate kinase
MMGAGKTRVGQALALRLGCDFCDTDAEVERAAGRSVAEIFQAEGEASFRERERAAVARCLQGQGVVALGGGAIAEPETAVLVSSTGTIVYLRARAETLLARVGPSHERPLLAGRSQDERLARLRELLAARESAYSKARLCVDTDDCALEDVVEAIVSQLAGMA